MAFTPGRARLAGVSRAVRVSRMLWPIPASVALLFAAAEPTAAQVWWERASCHQAIEAVLSADLAAAEARLSALEASRDPEDQACAVWARVGHAETQIAVKGPEKALLENRERRLLRMFGFAKSHEKRGRHLGDLEMEARVRRVRVLVDKGDRTDALKEAKRVKELLAERGGGDESPTLTYVRGVVDMAVSQSAWPLKMLLGMAGVSGDAGRGRKALTQLADGATVYRWDAIYVLRHFAEESPGPENGRPLDFSLRISPRFRTNPQLVYDHALDFHRERRCAEALEVAKPLVSRLEREPSLWSAQARAKLFWISGRCALDTGDRVGAQKWAELAAAQRFAGLEKEIAALKTGL